MDVGKIQGTFSILRSAFGKYRRRIFALVILGFLGGILEGVGINAVIPLFSLLTQGKTAAQDFVSQAIVKFIDLAHFPLKVWSLLVFIVILFVLRAVAIVIFRTIRANIRNQYLNETTSELFKRVLFASWPFLLKQKLGYVQSTFVRDIYRGGAVMDELGQVIMAFTSLFTYFLIAVNISPLITFLTMGGAAFFFFLLHPAMKKIKQFAEKTSVAEKSAAQHIGEHVFGVKTVKAGGVEKQVWKEGVKRFAAVKEFNMKTSVVHFLADAAIQPLSLIFIALIFLFFYYYQQLNLAAFAAAVYLIQKIFAYLQYGQSALHSIAESTPYLGNVNAFYELLGPHQETVSGKLPFDFKKSLKFNNVSLTYETGGEVLNDVSFVMPKGGIIGLIGPSGSGKTSIADLLLRLFKPNSGGIFLDGAKSDEIDIREWRKKIGYVSQDIFLINDTIENNIKFYQPEITDAVMAEAAKKANAYDFIENLSEGFKAIVGERGVMLSAGQRQRVVLARVLARNPEILILDEATSALDNESEVLIQKAINDLRGRITVLIIAHRLSTVMGVDNLLVLDSGKIVEQGRPQELLQDQNSHFYRVYHARDFGQL